MNRFASRTRACAFWAALVMVVVSGERAAQACGHCGRPSCPSYQVVEKTVMVPTLVPDARVINVTQYRCELQQQPRTVYRCVPEVQQVRQSYVAMVPQVRVREHVYYVAVPKVEEVEQPYVECVPEQVVRQGVRTVCRRVEVQEMRTVCRDMGHWEQVSCYSRSAHRCGCLTWLACGGCAPVVCCTQMVWVPNIVEEQVPVVACKYQLVQEPCEYVTTVYRQVQKVRRVPVCRYIQQERRCNVQETVLVPQRRERICNVTTYRQVAEEVMQQVPVMVPYQVQQETCVMVCRMVEKQVCCRVPVNCCDEGK